MNNKIGIFRWFVFTIVSAFYLTISGQVGRYDVIISEIMADPTPTVGLPAVEYLELHNRTDEACLLVGCTLRLGNTAKALPAISIDSGGYVLVIAEKNRELLEPLGVDIYTLSSLSITDGGTQLILSDANGEILHSVAFRKRWHQEVIKQEGGWALEMRDDRQPWLEEEGWASSVDPSGGTPGRANSLEPLPPDVTPPALWRTTMLDSLTLRLWCTEPLHPPIENGAELFQITPNIGIDGVSEVPPTFTGLDLHLAAAPEEGTSYRLEVIGPLPDCAGNPIPVGSGLDWGIASQPEYNDLVINEILTHPFDGTDADFVEIYNRSDQIIDLNSVKIGSGGDTLPEKAAVAVSSGMQLLPEHYAVLCKDRRATLSQYTCQDPFALIQCDSLPAYANMTGIVFLTDYSLRSIDCLAYDEEMHYGRLNSTEGVSLERLDPERATQDDGNWHSAAESAGFATPGYINSQHINDIPDGELSVAPEVISPDNDGFEDYALISLKLPNPECRVSIQLFDENGIPICHLANNELCGSEALFRWDGEDDQRRKVPRGLYIIDARWWNLEGKPGHKRKVVAVHN
ncbi:MAG: lamin tail domain-containing protein [Bacteroidales bacterium]|nr:lamin tail domain-containing protein [Bacteroidales bacterium]